MPLWTDWDVEDEGLVPVAAGLKKDVAEEDGISDWDTCLYKTERNRDNNHKLLLFQQLWEKKPTSKFERLDSISLWHSYTKKKTANNKISSDKQQKAYAPFSPRKCGPRISISLF